MEIILPINHFFILVSLIFTPFIESMYDFMAVSFALLPSRRYCSGIRTVNISQIHLKM